MTATAINSLSMFVLAFGFLFVTIVMDKRIRKVEREIHALRKKDGAFDRIDALEREIEKLRKRDDALESEVQKIWRKIS